MNPFAGLIKSRKFWLMVLDVVVSGSTYFIGKYAGADGQDMLFIIGLLQPVFVTVIASVTVEDNAQRKLDGTIVQAKEWRAEDASIAKKAQDDQVYS
jgi:hypothetical protein